MPLLKRRTALFAKAEAVQGVAETLGAADGKFRVINPSLQPNFNTFESEVSSDSLSPSAPVVTSRPMTLTFGLEVRRSSPVGTTADAWGLLLEACGYAQTTGASTVVYKPSSDSADWKTLTLGVNVDGVQTVVAGAMGNFEFVGEVGGVMLVNFTFQGFASTVAGVVIPAITHETGETFPFQGIELAYTADGSGVVDTTDICVAGVTLNSGNSLEIRECANNNSGITGYRITGRTPTLTIDPELVALTGAGANTDANFWQHIFESTKTEVEWKAGRKGSNASPISFSCPQVVWTSPSEGERGGIATLEMTGTCTTDTSGGDDEVVITMGAKP